MLGEVSPVKYNLPEFIGHKLIHKVNNLGFRFAKTPLDNTLKMKLNYKDFNKTMYIKKTPGYIYSPKWPDIKYQDISNGSCTNFARSSSPRPFFNDRVDDRSYEEKIRKEIYH